MTLRFLSIEIPGTTESYVKGSPALHARRVKYWDVVGEAEVVGERGGRPITVRHILHNRFLSTLNLKRALRTIDETVGQHGRLIYNQHAHGDIITHLDNAVTFEGYELLPLPGQEDPSPVLDLAGTMTDDDGNADNGWCQYLLLRFYQLVHDST